MLSFAYYSFSQSVNSKLGLTVPWSMESIQFILHSVNNFRERMEYIGMVVEGLTKLQDSLDPLPNFPTPETQNLRHDPLMVSRFGGQGGVRCRMVNDSSTVPN